MIIRWKSNVAGPSRYYPHVYLSMGVIGLRITSAQVLFDYTEIAHLITMKLSKTLFTSKLTNKNVGMKLNKKDFTWRV